MSDSNVNNNIELESQTSDKVKLTSIVNSAIVYEEPKATVMVAVHPYMKYFMYFIIFGGSICIFGAMLNYYLSQSTQTLVASDQLSQCSSSAQIISFPPLNQVDYFSPLLFVNGEELEQLYAYASFSACAFSSANIPTFSSANNSQYFFIDGTFSESLYDSIERKYCEAGIKAIGEPYKVPLLVFWNLRQTDGFPVLAKQKNTAMMSGFSPALLNDFCEKGVAAFEDYANYTPFRFLVESLSKPRYQCMEDEFVKMLV